LKTGQHHVLLRHGHGTEIAADGSTQLFERASDIYMLVK
jgi:hypothetical protein